MLRRTHKTEPKKTNRMTIRELILALVLFSVLMIVQASDDDEATLLAFQAGVSTGELASWNRSGSFCSWDGVTCSRRRPNRVVGLSLPSSKLAGTLSPAIGNLTFLRWLNLSSNELYGEIPPSVGRLQRLRVLDLNHNSFSGALPVNISSCISLTSLRLGFNQLGGRIPGELGNTLSKLEMLMLGNNSFTGPIPASVANLSSLQHLILDENHLEGPIPPGIGNMAELQALGLYGNSLQGVFPPSLLNLSSLKKLRVNYNMLHGSIPPDIGDKFPGMLVLALNNNWFSGAIPSSICNLSAVVILDLSANNFSGFVPPNLGRLRSVVHLYLGENELETDKNSGWEFMTSLANCSQLQGLSLSDNYFSGQLPRSILNLSTTLQELYLHNNWISGSIPEGIGNMIGLDLLSLGYNSISGVIPDSIGKLRNLATIGLYHTSLTGIIPSSIGNLTNMIFFAANNAYLGGPIPASLGDLKNLFLLDLSNNHLNGSIPREILELPSLSWFLDLSNNLLSGPLPSEVGSLANLNRLSLSGNQLRGQIPDSIGNCKVLEFLLLDRNSFEGDIPKSLTNLMGLNVLNISMNRLTGTIPDAVGSIGNLQQLCLAHNNFSGSIPATLQTLKLLWNLDVSFNNLQGKIPDGGVFRNLTYALVQGNDKLCGGIPRLRLPPCPVLAGSTNKKWGSEFLKKTLPIIITTMVFVSATALILAIHRKLKLRENREAVSSVIEQQYQRVSYHELSRGTNEFSEANLLGRGRYGSVYKCTLEGDGAIMAVKVFNLQLSGSSESFEAECETLRRVRHRCILKIITCCASIDPQGKEFKALVFEFMANGSLGDWLYPTRSNTLSFSRRLSIAVDIFDALDYLHNHTHPPIIHCDLKPGNILLAQDMSAKVGDFGMSRILPTSTIKTVQNSDSSIAIRGSIGYVAPEYGEGSAVSKLGDIYSLGILLLEMFTGRSPTDDTFKDSLDLHKFAAAALPGRALEIADQTMWLHEEDNDNDVTDARKTRSIIQQFLVSVLRLGISCSEQQPRERILLADAVTEMHTIRDAYVRSRLT